MIRPEQMPYTNPMDETYDSGNFAAVLDQALAARRLERIRGAAREVEHARAAARTRHGGVPRMDGRRRVRRAGDRDRRRPTATSRSFRRRRRWGRASRRPTRNSRVDVFDVPIEKIRIVQGDTDRGTGFGSAGSRSLFVGGSAIRVAAERTVQNAQGSRCARRSRRRPRDIEYAAGAFTVTGTDRRIGLFELAPPAAAAADPARVSVSSVAGPTWPNGCHHLRSRRSIPTPVTCDDRRIRLGERRRPRRQSADRDRTASTAAPCRASARRCAKTSSTTPSRARR